MNFSATAIFFNDHKIGGETRDDQLLCIRNVNVSLKLFSYGSYFLLTLKFPRLIVFEFLKTLLVFK